MPDVSKFVLDEQTITVKDATARSEASAAQASVQTLTADVNEIKALSRLTVNYTEQTETITFKTLEHNAKVGVK